MAIREILFSLEASSDSTRLQVLSELLPQPRLGRDIHQCALESSVAGPEIQLLAGLVLALVGVSRGSKQPDECSHLRRSLLSSCQMHLENCINPTYSCCLANCLFVCELYRRRLISDRIMFEIIRWLMLGKPPRRDWVPAHRAIVMLGALFASVGTLLDQSELAVSMDQFCDKIERLQDNPACAEVKPILDAIFRCRKEKWDAKVCETTLSLVQLFAETHALRHEAQDLQRTLRQSERNALLLKESLNQMQDNHLPTDACMRAMPPKELQKYMDRLEETVARGRAIERELRLCSICMEQEKVVIFYPCKHRVTCTECADSVSECPICRSQIHCRIVPFD